MDNRQIWKLAEELNVFQIILLIADYDPIEFENDRFEKWEAEIIRETAALRVVVQNAVIANKIAAKIEFYDGNYEGEISWTGTRIDVSSLTEWLKAKNFGNCFFTDESIAIPGFADSSGPFYAPKLAAAVDAWTIVTSNLELLKNRTPKQALDKWLREHAIEYGLTLESGDPNKQGIADISKIANWKPEGGATPTAGTEIVEIEGKSTPMSGGGQAKRNLATPSLRSRYGSTLLDDDIPF